MRRRRIGAGDRGTRHVAVRPHQGRTPRAHPHRRPSEWAHVRPSDRPRQHPIEIQRHGTRRGREKRELRLGLCQAGGALFAALHAELCSSATTFDSLRSPEHRRERKANPAMGQSKSLPVTSKFTVGEENDRIKYAASSMQGWRPYMEDDHATILDLDDSKSTSFFGVYDGHGGANVAKYCANRFHTELVKDVDYHDNLAIAMQHVYFRIDEQLQELDEWRALANPPRVNISMIRCLKSAVCANVWFPGKGTPYKEGSTACVALIRGNQIIVGNVGDSRCVLSRNGQAIDLSTDHKPNLPDESARILNAGGRIIRDALPRKLLGRIVGIQWGAYRVNGQLAMSRAIGDFGLKKNRDLPPAEQMVTCNPEIRTVDITDDTEFLLIASDGIWDAASSQHVVNFVHHHLTSGETDLRAICERLLDSCMRTKDNMTVILVQFKPSAVPVVDPTNIAGSSNNPYPTASTSSNPSAVAEAKADDDTEITEVKEEQPSSRATEVDEKEPGVNDEDRALLPTSSSTEES